MHDSDRGFKTKDLCVRSSKSLGVSQMWQAGRFTMVWFKQAGHS